MFRQRRLWLQYCSKDWYFPRNPYFQYVRCRKGQYHIFHKTCSFLNLIMIGYFGNASVSCISGERGISVSGFSGCIPVTGWSGTRVSFKFFTEIIQIMKSYAFTDLRYGQGRMCQKIAGVTEPYLGHICHGSGI